MNKEYNEVNLKPSIGDHAHTTVKAGLSMIPIVGGPASELFSAVITPPLSKRRDEWMDSISTALMELQGKVENFNIENLSENEIFITTVMQATQSAIRNHQEEKINSLRNAVLNSAISIPINEDLQMVFLNLIDSLTSWHLRILKFFTNPIVWFEQHNIISPSFSMGSPSRVLEHAFPELRGNPEFYSKITRDLYTQGLMNTESLNTTMTSSGAFAPRTTNMGIEFVRYITEPVIGN